MAKVMNYVKAAYPKFFKDVADRRNNIEDIRKKYEKVLPDIMADVTTYARETGIEFKFDLA